MPPADADRRAVGARPRDTASSLATAATVLPSRALAAS
jgi:hypothetical protein